MSNDIVLENKNPNPEQALKQAFDMWVRQLQKLARDLKAIEILTAVGETTFNIEHRGAIRPGSDDFDITDLANIEGNQDKDQILQGMTILARTILNNINS